MINNKHIFQLLANTFYLTIFVSVFSMNIQSKFNSEVELTNSGNNNQIFDIVNPRISPPTPPYE